MAEDVVLVDEGHLDVDLGELGLPVDAEVLVAEAAGDLEVAVEARHHVELLEELRALGERVELPGVQPRRHEEVARAARRVLHQHGGLELVEAVVGEVPPHRLVHDVARAEHPLELRAPQVEVAELEPLLLVGDTCRPRFRRAASPSG
jgi:hypothetical protein